MIETKCRTCGSWISPFIPRATVRRSVNELRHMITKLKSGNLFFEGNNMKCTYCIEREKEWSKCNDPIECAFEGGFFSANNWNCGLMSILREQAEKTSSWNDDFYAGIVPYCLEKDDEIHCMGYLYLEWYKSRGKTDRCFDMDTLSPLTLDKAYEICSLLTKISG